MLNTYTNESLVEVLSEAIKDKDFKLANGLMSELSFRGVSHKDVLVEVEEISKRDYVIHSVSKDEPIHKLTMKELRQQNSKANKFMKMISNVGDQLLDFSFDEFILYRPLLFKASNFFVERHEIDAIDIDESDHEGTTTEVVMTKKDDNVVHINFGDKK